MQKPCRYHKINVSLLQDISILESGYCIARNFQGRKFLRIGKNDHLVQKTFHGMLTLTQVGTTCPFFEEKTFTGVSKATKFVNVFFFQSLPLYGMTVVKNRGRGSRAPDFPVSKPIIERFFFFHVLQSLQPIKDYNKSTIHY